MKIAKVFVDGVYAGNLIEKKKGTDYQFAYVESYQGPSVSLTMPTEQKAYQFNQFPPFFEGLLPEGFWLSGLLLKSKIDSDDFFEQLIRVGSDMVGNVTVERGTE
jgi:serine/threonine-protein kinase HipA